jgi:hypothetical protein
MEEADYEPSVIARYTRWKKILELRAQGLPFRAISAHVTTLDGARPLSAAQVSAQYRTAMRVLRHPSRARRLAEYEATGTFTDFWKPL